MLPAGKTEAPAIAKRARANGATVWALTGTDSSPLAEIVHGLTILPTATNEQRPVRGSLLKRIVLLGMPWCWSSWNGWARDMGYDERHTNLE